MAVLLWVLALPAAVAAGVRVVRGDLAAPPARVGVPLAAERVDTAGVSLTVARVPTSGQDPAFAEDDRLVAAVVEDLQSFWAREVPAITGAPFVPLRGGLTAVDSAAPSGTAPCVGRPDQINGNAYYCPSDDGIVFDSSALVPVLLSRYGTPGLVGAFAHEFGHAVQARIGPTAEQRSSDPSSYPSLLVEAQGDCDAGAFLAWAVAGNAPHIHLDKAGMAAAVGPLLDFADPVTVPVTDPAAHGLSLDRLTSLLVGYRSGAAACHAMTLDSLHPTLGQVPLPAGGTASLATPRFVSTAAALDAARASVGAFAGFPVSDVAPDPAALADAQPYGQSAQATLIAVQAGAKWAAAHLLSGSTTVPPRAGTPADSTATAGEPAATGHAADAAAACFAGAWVASVFGRAPQGSLGSWPGDADEGLDAVRTLPGSSFADDAGYADGFHGGLAACR